MSDAEASLHRPAPRRSYRRFLIACAALAMALSLLPPVTEAQQCLTYADCTCTPLSDSSVYPMAGDDGLGFATPQAECEYIRNLPFFIDSEEEVRAVGYLGVDYNHNGCLRGRRSLSQKSLAKGWRAWGTADNMSVSGPGAHVVMAWTKKDADGKTYAVIELYASGIYRTSRIGLLDVAETDHITFCRILGREITVPTQNGQADGPACCGKPYPKTPGERCTYRPNVLPGRQCRGPM
jgi:hypothetical protein